MCRYRASVTRRPTIESYLSDDLTTPAVAGITRPVILLPATAESWTSQDLRVVLLHELSHVARRDGLLNLLADLSNIVYWCNPLVRYAVRGLRVESERACDDRVLRDGAEAETYAQLLLTFARTARAHDGLTAASTAIVRPHELESRLVAVLDAGVTRDPLRRGMPALVAALALLLTIPTAAATVVAAPLQLPALRSPEPDRAGDALAAPTSERLPRQFVAIYVSPRVQQALSGPDSLLVAQLITALEHEPRNDADLIRERAAWALSQVRDGRLVEPLIAALDDPDWRVQAYAAWALATAHDRRAVARMIPLLEHPVWRLRAMAAYAIHQSHDPRDADAMHTALSDPAWQVRLQAVQYFAMTADKLTLATTVRPLLQDRHIAVRNAAQSALITR